MGRISHIWDPFAARFTMLSTNREIGYGGFHYGGEERREREAAMQRRSEMRSPSRRWDDALSAVLYSAVCCAAV